MPTPISFDRTDPATQHRKPATSPPASKPGAYIEFHYCAWDHSITRDNLPFGQLDRRVSSNDAEAVVARLNGADLPAAEPYQAAPINTHAPDFGADKLSDLITHALVRLEMCERHESRYVIRMQNFHTARGNLVLVGLAGCVMAKTLNASSQFSYRPAHYPPKIAAKLQAIHAAAFGHTAKALGYLRTSCPGSIPTVAEPWTSYHKDRDIWLQSMRDQAALLRSYRL